MTKKFVKADLNTLGRKEQKPPPNYYRTKEPERPAPKPRPRQTSTFQEKGPVVDLRKYFEVFPVNEEIKALTEKFPGFFMEMSMHPEQLRSGKPQNDSFKVGSAYNPTQQFDDADMPDWQSEGEVELGEKISQEIANRVQNIERKNIGELKQYEKEFLEEELRKRMKLQEQQDQRQQEERVTRAQSKPIVKSEDSDEEVDIKRTIQITQTHTALPTPVSRLEDPSSHRDEILNIADDEPDDDNRFKDSSDASDNDDDIFGSGSDKEKEEEPAPVASNNTASTHGHIKFVKGQFSMFALSRNVAEDQPIWSITNDTMSRLQQNLTSEWMDQHYLEKHRQQCPLVCFDSSCNNYIPYEMFSCNHDIKFFQSLKFVEGFNKKLNNNKKSHPQNFLQQYPPVSIPVGTYQPRKLSEHELAPEPARPGRKYSNNYKVKPQQK